MADGDNTQPLDSQTIATLLAGTPGEGAVTPNPNIQPESQPMDERPKWQVPPQLDQVKLTPQQGYQGGRLPAIVELARGSSGHRIKL